MISIGILSIVIWIVLIIFMALFDIWMGMLLGFAMGALLLIPIYLLNRKNSREKIDPGEDNS